MSEQRTQQYTAALARMIRADTLSLRAGDDPARFLAFHELLAELFPHIFAVCEKEVFSGSLLLRWKGSDAEQRPVIFMNHSDVVEAGTGWTHDPFGAEVADGRLWGRGTLDTKCGLWAMLQAADELAAQGAAPIRDIYFLSAATEETDGSGARAIVAELLRREIRAEMLFDEGGMILDEPIGGAKGLFAMVGVGEKGVVNLKFIARSQGGHASTPGKNTPLVRLGKFMAEVERSKVFRAEISPTLEELLRRLAPHMGNVGHVMKHPKLFGGLLKIALPAISPTAGALVKTTIAFTMAQGSQCANVLPAQAWVLGDMRCSHHQGEEASIAALKPIADKYDIAIEVTEHCVTSRVADHNGTAFRTVERAIAATLPEVQKAVPYLMTGASDARFYDPICDQCIRFLPFTIDDQQLASIHGADENICIDTLAPAVDYYKFIMKEM